VKIAKTLQSRTTNLLLFSYTQIYLKTKKHLKVIIIKVVAQLLETINYAIEKKTVNLEYDFTLLCKVTKVYSQERKSYQIQYKDTFYNVTTKNIPLYVNDIIHLIVPKGNFSNKYVLEDVALNYIERTR